MKKTLLIGSILGLLIGMLLAVNIPTAFAVTAGPNNAGTGANVDRSGASTAWSNPGNITVVDSPYATATLGNNHSDYLQATNYGFNIIPADATITGIMVSIRRKSSLNTSGDSIHDDVVSLIKGGAITGDNKKVSTDWPTSFGVANYGGDLWGTTWTPAQINASNFGVALSVETENNQSRTATVDYIQVTVTYTLPHIITASAGVGGSISPSGSVSVSYGADKTFTIAPGTGYVVSDILVDSGSQGRINSYTFNNVTIDHTISASFDGGWRKPTDTHNDHDVNYETRAYLSDNLYAVFNDENDQVDYDDFGLSASSSATITGIEVALEGNRTSGRTLYVSLTWDEGSHWTTAKNVSAFSATDSTIIAGGSSDTWGHTWTPTQLDNSHFRVRTDATSGGGDLNLDQIQVKVYYTLPKIDQTITFDNPGNKTYGDLPFNLIASSDSGLSVSFDVVSGPATLSGNEITLIHAGNVTVEASQAGDDNYNPATPVDQTFNVAKATPFLDSWSPADIADGGMLDFISHLTAVFKVMLNGVASDIPGGSAKNYDPNAVTAMHYSDGAQQILSVEFVPTNTEDFNSASATSTIHVLEPIPSPQENTEALCSNQLDDDVDGFIDLDDPDCSAFIPPAMGSIEITKYACPEGTTVTRTENGVVEGTPPYGCVPQEGAYFGYIHNSLQSDAGSPWDEFDDPPTAGGVTNESGILTIPDLSAVGRYAVVETNGDNQKLPDSDVLGLYCVGDEDPNPTHNDNGDLTFVPAGGTAGCVAYNKAAIATPPDETPPSVPVLESPVNGFETNINPVLSWFASTDLISSIINYTVGFFTTATDTVPSVTFVVGTSTSYNTSDGGGFSDGTYYWGVQAEDESVNSSGWSELWSFIKDTASSIISLLSPTPGYYNSPISISGSATDMPVYTIASVDLSYEKQGETEFTGITTLENASSSEPFDFSYLWTPDSDGTYTIQAIANDEAGNLSEPAVVENVVYDITHPTTPVADPTGGNQEGDVTVYLSSEDVNPDAIYYTVDGSEPDASSTLYDGTGIAIGVDTTVKAIAYDEAGNASEIMTETYGIPPIISEESHSSVGTTSFTVTWTTDDLSTSRVIYDTISHSVLDTSTSNYGYAYSTVEDSNKVTIHSVVVSGLTARTTYYYRVVSHGSPEAVGSEQSTKTNNSQPPPASSGGGGGGAVTFVTTSSVPPAPIETTGGGLTFTPTLPPAQGPTGGGEIAPTETPGEGETVATTPTPEQLAATAITIPSQSLFANVLDAITGLKWYIIVLLIILLLAALWFFRKNKRRGNGGQPM